MKKPGRHWVHPDPFVDAVAVDVVVDKLTLRRTHNSVVGICLSNANRNGDPTSAIYDIWG